MKAFLLLPLLLLFTPISANAQEIRYDGRTRTYVQTCTTWRTYSRPGYYDQYGNYFRGGIVREPVYYNCGGYVAPPPVVAPAPYYTPVPGPYYGQPYYGGRPYYGGGYGCSALGIRTNGFALGLRGC
jgi:hypothetical protein